MGRTLQIATRTQPNLKLKFVYNETFNYSPHVQGTDSGVAPYPQEMMLVGFAANTIKSLHCDGNLTGSANVTGVWRVQTSGGTDGIITSPNAQGYDEWKDRYTYATVIGSKITVSAKTVMSTEHRHEPTLMFLHKTGSDEPGTIFNISNGAEHVNDKAYISKALIMSSNVSTGATIKMGYSAKKFEGKRNIVNAADYRLSMYPYAKPEEESSWILGFCNARGTDSQPLIQNTGANSTTELLIQVKIEYIVVLTEPKTGYNPPPAPGGMEMG